MSAQRGICHRCASHGTCEGETPLVPRETCWKFTAPECETCEELHPERACDPPTCLAGFVEEVRP